MKVNFLTRKDKQTSLDMIRELIDTNKQLREENRYLRQCNIKLNEQNRKLAVENFELKYPAVHKNKDGTFPGWFFYAEMRCEGDRLCEKS